MRLLLCFFLTLSAVPFLSAQSMKELPAGIPRRRPPIEAPERTSADEARDLHEQGVALYRKGKFKEAAELFKQALDKSPDYLMARLYLGAVYRYQFVPGLNAAENLKLADDSIEQFRRVVEFDNTNKFAVSSLASLYYLQSLPLPDGDAKRQKLEDSWTWNKRFMELESQNMEPVIALGTIAYTLGHNAIQKSKVKLQAPEGAPLPDAAERAAVRAQVGPKLDDAITALEDAMTRSSGMDTLPHYASLLHRLRASLADSPDAYQRELASADQWARKADEARRRGRITMQ